MLKDTNSENTEMLTNQTCNYNPPAAHISNFPQADVSNKPNDTISGEIRYIPHIPMRAFKLLKTLQEDHDFLAGAPSKRPMKHYTRIHDVTKKTIGNDFAYLESLGLCKSLPGGKGNSRKRWITCEGYSYLVDQASPYISPYNPSTPYIDLPEKEMINFKSLEEEQICGQSIDQELENFLEHERTAPSEREEINTAIRTSRIGPVRKEQVIRRVVAANKKKPILDKKSYFLACIENERRELKKLFDVFRGKPILVNLYAQP